MEGDVEAWLESPDQRKPHQFLRRYEQELDAGLHADVYPPQSHAANDEPGESRESVLDLLDANLGLQVLRYLHLSPWNYTSADVVNGCVEYALQHVFKALEKLHKGRVPDDEGFADDGWGYVEERICAAAHRRNGDQPVEQKSAGEWSHRAPSACGEESGGGACLRRPRSSRSVGHGPVLRQATRYVLLSLASRARRVPARRRAGPAGNHLHRPRWRVLGRALPA